MDRCISRPLRSLSRRRPAGSGKRLSSLSTFAIDDLLSRPLSNEKRAYYRLDWHERFARNERASGAPQISITLFGVPEDFAAFLGVKVPCTGGAMFVGAALAGRGLQPAFQGS
jgi:hypothetical protein